MCSHARPGRRGRQFFNVNPGGEHAAMASPDLLILGGGIAALWTLRRARDAGYSALLLTREGIGGRQTLASQGVIHGGMKYALAGALTDASEALRDMPRRWRSALAGSGEIDLRGVPVTAPRQVLWSGPGLAARATAFFAGKALSSRVAPQSRAEAPAPFNHPDFQGVLYTLDEFALDTPALVQALAAPVAEDLRTAQTLTFHAEAEETVAVEWCGQRLRPALIACLAGEGNAGLLTQAGCPDLAPMQRRPLHQVLVQAPDLPDLFGVCLGGGPKPRLVVTTHRVPGRDPVWYLGGELAEAAGVARSEAEQISVARQELAALFPWLGWSRAHWSTLRIDRAEAADRSGDRPSGVTWRRRGNLGVGWPTKLALAPCLADDILAELAALCPRPSPTAVWPGEPPTFATAPWS
jgi:hypothetical protein